jgi:hypothetical protein
MDDEWTPWIDHNGLGCPVPFGTWVHAKGIKTETQGWAGERGGGGWKWKIPHPYKSVISYRVRKPRGMGILKALVENIPEKVNADGV